MKKFSEIKSLAEKRKGGKSALQQLLPEAFTSKKLLKITDDRYLSMMTKVINQAGFRWSVIEKKWPQFEEAFFGFDTYKLSLLSPEQWDAYMQDVRVVRNGQKIKALIENVLFVREESQQRGSLAHLLAEWPAEDLVGLFAYLKKQGSRLGGQTGQRFLRNMGKDTFVITSDVVLAMKNAGLDIADNPNSQRDMRKIQTLMNEWHQQSGLPYAHLSKIASCSVGVNYSMDELMAN